MAESNEKVGLGELRQASDALGLALPETALERLLVYRDLLIRWNRVYNLTALRDPQEMLSHHLIDCLAVIPPLRRHLAGRADAALARPVRVVDVGSGCFVFDERRALGTDLEIRPVNHDAGHGQLTGTI